MKKCNYCESTFDKIAKLSYKQFEEMKFCSKDCASKSLKRVKAISCPTCKVTFEVRPSRIKRYCSIKCIQRISKLKVEIICKSCKNIFQVPSYRMGYRTYCSKKCQGDKQKKILGEKHFNWKGNEVIKKNERNDSAYQQWVTKVKRRDKNKCRIKSESCSGYNIIHHILPWRLYIEERYNINNGITLCQFHHPRKRIDEQRMMLTFQGLVNA